MRVDQNNGRMPRRLIVLRHAKSDWPAGVPDRRRPLGPRGRREAPLAGRWLNEHVQPIDLVVCSTAERASQTWALVAEELDPAPELRMEARVYDASETRLLDVIRELPESAATVLFVGHNPGLEDLISVLTGRYCVMKTSSIAVMSSDAEWAAADQGWATLEAAETPRM
jgi:phosphohistidine phosphatase